MPSDPVVLSVANVQPETQIPFLCLEDGADAPFLERMEKIIHSFQDIVDLYNQPASPPPTDDLLVRMTKHSQALHDFQSYCFAGIEEMKAYLEENMTKWKNLAQSQMEELCRLKVELEQQNLSQKKDAKTLKTVEDQLQAKQKALKDVEKEKKQQEKKVEELQKKLIAAQEETRKRESVVQAHELKIQQLNSQVGAHKKELNDAKKNQPNPQAAGAEKKKFESKIAELDRGLAAAQSKAKSEEEKATAARNERNSAMEKQKAHFRELQKARKDLEDVRKKAQLDLQAQAASFTGQDERWKEKLFRLEQDHVLVKQSLEAKIVDLAGSMQTQSQELDRQRGVVQRQKEQIQRQQEQIQRQQEQIQCQQEQIHRQQEQIQAQQEDIQSLRQKLKQADSERQVLTQMVRDLQQQVKDIEKGIVHYQPFGVSLPTSFYTQLSY
ncbi:hypothetical protein M413DRAFT_131423 [Hebeloma cylindrosporum]|uniref:Uncharacterized protein n=1 Tax=Hebeloma cylindrosporum TaxID=76867 RepID=A0A0C3C0B9_HEBCY|nr:hypothetical protein M413DRAFT_131423 [Hebeloma cylindrosporum h7]